MTPDQEATFAEIVRALPTSAPEGWLRIVGRHECNASGAAMVDVVVVQTPAGLAQETYREPRDVYWTLSDFHKDLARSAPSGSVVLTYAVDRDGSSRAEVVEEDSRLMAGVRDESSSVPIHRYLERNRAELEELARRI